MHPLKAAVERKASREEFAALFAPDAVFYPPMLVKPVTGVESILSIISLAPGIAIGLNYTDVITSGNKTLLFWNGLVENNYLDAITIITDNEHGLIGELRVMMRPWAVATLFKNAMYKSLSTKFGPEYWEVE